MILEDINIKNDIVKNNIFLGNYYEKDSYVVELEISDEELDKFISENKGLEFVFLADVYLIDEEIYLLAARATQIIDWENNHQLWKIGC